MVVIPCFSGSFGLEGMLHFGSALSSVHIKCRIWRGLSTGPLCRILTGGLRRSCRGLQGMLYSSTILLVAASVLDYSTLRLFVKFELHNREGATKEHAAGGVGIVKGLQVEVLAQWVAGMGFDKLVNASLAEISLTKSLSRLSVDLRISVEIIHSLDVCNNVSHLLHVRYQYTYNYKFLVRMYQ